jgi:hypothetical protein
VSIKKQPTGALARLKEILVDSDISLASFLMGLGLWAFGLTAFFAHPEDFLTFAQSMEFTGGTLWWLANYLGAGAGFIYIAMRNFPPLGSLLIGSYASLVWIWIAYMRSYSNATSGVSLNFIVIAMGFLLVQRGARK